MSVRSILHGDFQDPSQERRRQGVGCALHPAVSIAFSRRGDFPWRRVSGYVVVTAYWVYVLGPLIGAVVAEGFACVLRGPGGGKAGSAAAQGDLCAEVQMPGKA